MDKDISVLGPATSPNDLIEGAGNYICHYATQAALIIDRTLIE